MRSLTSTITRRSCLKSLAATAFLPIAGRLPASDTSSLPAGPASVTSADAFRLRYVLGSCMYGTTRIAEILGEVKKSGADAIDIWPRVHGNQREEVDAMGLDAFATLLKQHDVRLGILTRYDLGPFKLQNEIEVAQTLGCKLIICGSRGPRGLKGKELKAAVAKFLEALKPHAVVAAKHGVTIGVENHSGQLLQSADSVRYFGDLLDFDGAGLALAPYHLPQDEKLLADLIAHLDKRLVHVYAWQHGKGCTKKLPKEDELLQMPGRGDLDFRPLARALAKIHYAGFTEIFMHPVPRGIPILPATAEVTAEIRRAREYLDRCAKAGADTE